MQGTTSYRCAAYERCDITPYSRNSCQFCRLQKCYAVGMSRQGKHNTPDTAMVSAFDKNASRFTECICELRFYAVEQCIIMQRME